MFHLAWPWVFILLPLPLLLRMWLPPCNPADSALRVPFFNRLTLLTRQHRQLRQRFRMHMAIPALIWLLVVLAAARPQWLEAQRPLDFSARSSMLAVDLSASMLAEDLGAQGTNRFMATRNLVLQLLEQRPGDRFGLIFFASQAFLQSPLTFDHDSLRHWLYSVEPGIAGDNTAIGDAIGLGIKRLRQLPASERNLILLTDGANNSGVMPPRTAARFAAREGIRIHALGIGQAGTGGQDGPDLDLLQDIAWLTGGRYLHVDSAATLPRTLDLLDSLSTSSRPGQPVWRAHELYGAPLLAAMLLAMLHPLLLLLPTNLACKRKMSP